MKTRELLSLLLSCAILFGCIGSSFAANADKSEVEPYNTNFVYHADNLSLQNGASGNLFYFRLDDTFSYGKIWIQNDSVERVRVTYTYKGNEYDFGDGKYVESGSSKSFYIVGGRSKGDFYLNVSTVNGYLLEGSVTIKVGTKAGVGYPGRV